MVDPDLAEQDKRRLTLLLEVDTDRRLRASPSPVEPLPGAEWTAGFVDTEADIKLAAYFIADPDGRSRAAASVTPSAAGETVETSTNGALLLVVRSAVTDESVRDRVDDLLSRFSGLE